MTPRKTSRRKAPRRKMQKSRRMNRKNLVKQRGGGMLSESKDANTVALEEYNLPYDKLSEAEKKYCIAVADWNRRNESASTTGPRPSAPWF